MPPRPKNPYQEKVPFYLPHAALTASVLCLLMKATAKMLVDVVRYFNGVGLAEHASDTFAAHLLRIPAIPNLVVPDFTFVGEADDDTATATAHGLQTGDGPFRVANSGGALPTGLAAATDYWVIRTGANTFKFAASRMLAYAGTAIDLTGDGSGTQTMSDTASTTRHLVIATIFDTDSDLAGTNTLAVGWTTPATLANNVLEKDDELAIWFLEQGTATLPAGHLHGEAKYL